MIVACEGAKNESHLDKIGELSVHAWDGIRGTAAHGWHCTCSHSAASAVAVFFFRNNTQNEHIL